MRVSNTSDAAQAKACGELVGALQDRLVFAPLGENLRARALDAKEAADGSVWSVQSVTTLSRGYEDLYLTHHAADGELLGVSDAIASEAERSLIDAALAVDAEGLVTVAVYSSFAETADSEVLERLTLHRFDRDLRVQGLARAFRGLATPHLSSGALGSVWLAGNAAGNAAHGAISRISNGEPDWIQTAVPTSGQGVGGISALTVADDGFAAVVGRLNPKWSGDGPNVVKLGISTFDEFGTPLWSLALPTEYTQGYLGALSGTADGSLVVAGRVGEQGEALLVQGVSRAGEIGWSYQLAAGFGPSLEVRRDSGRTFVALGNELAVIDRDGESCRRFSVPGPATSESPPWQPDAEYVLVVGGELTRLRVPE